MARLVTGLYDESRDVFTLLDVSRITEISPSAAASLISNAVRRGVVTRIKRGHFILVPYELGNVTVYTGNPLIVGHRLLGDHQHFVSHGSAMSVHGMTTQPRMVTQFSCVAPPRSFTSHGVEYQFISRKARDMFGMSDQWITPQQKVPVSDIERTIIDGLDQTGYVGGYSEIDKGTWMRRSDINPDKLVDYALRLGSGAVIRRLGFLLDSCDIGSDQHRAALRGRLTATYHLLDPLLPKEGPYQSRWRLQINVDPEELQGARYT